MTKNRAPAASGLLADFLHGSISVTALERFISSTPAFNRLHEVKQNSTAYLTYPSMVHSRFAHSLGAMHLASRMFVSAMGNASDVDRNRFLDAIGGLIVELTKFNVVVKASEGQYANWQSTEIKRQLDQGARRTLLVYRSAPPQVADERLITYCVALQALRVAALVHDLGHPPFSHVTEYAIKKLAQELGNEANDTKAKEALAEARTRWEREEKAPHELLTLDVFDDLTSLVTMERPGLVFREEGDIIFARVSMALAAGILRGGEFPILNAHPPSEEAKLATICLRSLEDGELDADRMDYVQRDVLMAGIRDRGFRDDRLISLLKLVYTTEDEVSRPHVVPSLRSLRSLEEFFEWRSELYRTIIYHHHVVRTDGFFQAIVHSLSRPALADASLDDSPSNQLRPQLSSLKWLWKIYALDAGAHVKMDIYLQWDDHWLLSVLRHKYLSLKAASAAKQSAGGMLDQDTQIELARLEEIVASKKNYISLVKRFEHYMPITEAFASRWNELVLEAEAAEDVNLSHYSSMSAAMLAANGPDGPDTVFERLNSAILNYLSSTNGLSHKGALKNLVVTVVQNAVVLFKERSGCLDLFWENKPYKPGIQEKFKLWTDDGVVALKDHSNVIRELYLRAMRAPQNFFYALPQTKVDVKVGELRKQLGSSLAESLFAIVKMKE